MKDFKKLRIWQYGMEVANLAYDFVAAFPKEEKYGLSSQITRAAISIPSNIAEGSSRATNKDYGRFIDLSIGSSYELETQVLIARRLNFGNQSVGEKLLAKNVETQRMLIGFKKVLS